MNNEDEKVILPEDDEAAIFTTVKGWVSRNKKFFGNKGDAEQLARIEGSTHKKCECGAIYKKDIYTICPACREQADKARHEKREKVKWDGETPIYCEDGDVFFHNEDELMDYCDEHGLYFELLRLVLCEPTKAPILEPLDFLRDAMAEDSEFDLPDSVFKAAETFNAIVAEIGPMAWVPGDKAIFFEIEHE